MSTCSRCQQPLRVGAKFCAGCGLAAASAVDASVTCPHCRSPVRFGAKFCARCGQTLVPQSAVMIEQPLVHKPLAQRPLPPIWIFVTIAILVMVLLISVGAVWYSGQPVDTATPMPNSAATVTHAAATPTLVPALETAVPISD